MNPERVREIEYAYHVRAFGEEWARINFLPLEERLREVASIVDFARSHGVPFSEAGGADEADRTG
jgi:hypothetical protein